MHEFAARGRNSAACCLLRVSLLFLLEGVEGSWHCTELLTNAHVRSVHAQAKKKEKLAVGPLMLAFFVFVVIGSGMRARELELECLPCFQMHECCVYVCACACACLCVCVHVCNCVKMGAHSTMFLRASPVMNATMNSILE